jgi:hypothetical protein
MDLFMKAKEALTVDVFSKKRCNQAIDLCVKAEGRERALIMRMFESQFVLARSAEDTEWLQAALRRLS